MIKTSTFLKLLTVLLGLSGMNLTAQSNLLIGYRSGSSYQDSLTFVDTTGGTFTYVESKQLTTTFGAPDPVNGLFGMAIEPLSGDMYCVYGVAASDTRRLGKLNITTGVIGDLGMCGNITDITFVDTILYCTTGTVDGYKYGWLNRYTAAYTPLFTHLNADWSNAINFDFHNEYVMKSTQTVGSWDSIAVDAGAEANLFIGAHPGWTTCLQVVNDSTMLTGGSSTINTLNTSTYAYSSVYTTPSQIHSMSFSELQVSLWVNGSRNSCGSDAPELFVVGTGASYEWYKDGSIVAGATSSTLVVLESGVYYAIVDGVQTNSVTMTISNPSAAFTMSENPAYIGGAASVDVDFLATAVGPYLYSWDSGDGATATVPNPTFTYSAIGGYPVELTVTDTVSGCIATGTQTLVVAGGVGISDLNVEFNVFPNPTSDIVTITYSGNENYNAELIGQKGETIQVVTIQPGIQNTIDVSTLANGIYYLKITNDAKSSKYKIIKK